MSQSGKKTLFPLVDALLTTPDEGRDGRIGICTNTTASGQVLNEIEPQFRKDISVLGTLIVNRDGAERLILNALVHPSMKYIVLFAEETLTFSSSTNLLLALMNGYETKSSGNFIKSGVGAAHHYPNISEKILSAFREQITVLPIFRYTSPFSKKFVIEYLEWIKPRVSEKIYQILIELNSKKKIYYDSLNQLINEIQKLPADEKEIIELDVKDFQHLQPPKRQLQDITDKLAVPFRVRRENSLVRIDIETDSKAIYIRGEDEFQIGYTLMEALKSANYKPSSIQQLLIGAELGRVSTELINDMSLPPLIQDNDITGIEEVKLTAMPALKTDKEFYYKVSANDSEISVMCMAFDSCEDVFELRSKEIFTMLIELAKLNRFQSYDMEMLHRFDIGVQVARAGMAAKHDCIFVQDFSLIFKVNKTKLPFIIVEGDSFLDVHKKVLMEIYSKGITEEHGDPWKGLSRTASVLAIYREAEVALEKMPVVYQQGSDNTALIRERYKEQLLRFDHDGSYSYGERTRSFFGFDQLERTVDIIKKDPTRACIIQRFDPTCDMGTKLDPETGKKVFSHDPCLTHDIYFVFDKKLYAFHIARAHNTVNAYPENIFGLFDAYTTTIQEQLKLPMGDMFVLSNRANILLLTEEQRTKKLLSEPSKPMSGKPSFSVGPYELAANINQPSINGGVAYLHIALDETLEIPDNKILNRLKDLKGINTIDRAITYLKEKGVMHNNPVLSEYRAGESDPQMDGLVFWQANVFGQKLHATAVFMNRSLSKKEEDIKLCNYLATLYSAQLNVELGDLTLIYVAYT